MVTYSTLCDSDPKAYFAYLAVVALTCKDGIGLEQFVGVGGSGGVRKIGSGGDGDGVTAVSVFAGLCRQAGIALDGTADVGSVDTGGDCVSGFVGDKHGGNPSANVGLANSDGCCADSCVGGGVGVRRDGSAAVGCMGQRDEAPARVSASAEGRVESVLGCSELVGRARRRAKRREKSAGSSAVGSSGDGVVAEECVRIEAPVADSGKRGVSKGFFVKGRSDSRAVPEWRVRPSSDPIHRGAFAECDSSVQKDLRESRAKRLIAENRMAAMKADADTRRLEAQSKARMVERDVECRRLALEVDIKEKVERQFGVDGATGFAETIVSNGLEGIIPVPELDGSVSPSSSISVAEVNKLEKAVRKLSDDNRQLRLENEKLKTTKDVKPVIEEKFDIDFISEEDEQLMQKFRLKQAACQEFYGKGGKYFDGIARGYEDSEPSIDELKWRMEGNMPTPK